MPLYQIVNKDSTEESQNQNQTCSHISDQSSSSTSWPHCAEEGFSPINSFQQLHSKTSPVTFISPPSGGVRTKRVKKRANVIQAQPNYSQDSFEKVQEQTMNSYEDQEGAKAPSCQQERAKLTESVNVVPVNSDVSNALYSQGGGFDSYQQNPSFHSNNPGSGRSSVSSSKTSSPKKNHHHQGGYNRGQGHHKANHEGNDGRNMYFKNTGNYRSGKGFNSPKKRGAGNTNLNYGGPYSSNKYKHGGRNSTPNTNPPMYKSYHDGSVNYFKRRSPVTFQNPSDSFPGSLNMDQMASGAIVGMSQSTAAAQVTDLRNKTATNILAMLTSNVNPANQVAFDPSVSPVPPIQTQQAASLVTSPQVDNSQVANQSSATIYLSPALSDRRSSTEDVTPPCATPSKSTSTQDQMVSVVINQTSFQTSSSSMTSARPDVSSESAALFAANPLAVPTVRDVNNNNSGNNRKPDLNTPSNNAGQLYQNNSYSSKRKNKNQPGNGNKMPSNAYNGSDQRFNDSNRTYQMKQGRPLNNFPQSSSAPQTPNSPYASMIQMNKNQNYSDFSDLLNKLGNNTNSAAHWSIPNILTYMKALTDSLAINAGSVANMDQRSASADNSVSRPSTSASTPPAVTHAGSVAPSIAALVGPSLTLAPNPAQMGFLNLFAPNQATAAAHMYQHNANANKGSGFNTGQGRQIDNPGGLAQQSNAGDQALPQSLINYLRSMSAVNNAAYQTLNNSNLSDTANIMRNYHMLVNIPTIAFPTGPSPFSFSSFVHAGAPIPQMPSQGNSPYMMQREQDFTLQSGYQQDRNGGASPVNGLDSQSHAGVNATVGQDKSDSGVDDHRDGNSKSGVKQGQVSRGFNQGDSMYGKKVQGKQQPHVKGVNQYHNAKKAAQMSLAQNYSVNKSSQSCKRGSFCIVVPDEVGRSAYHCAGLEHHFLIEIWNPTSTAIKIISKVHRVHTILPGGSMLPLNDAQSPFRTEGTFMMAPDEKSKLKLIFNSYAAGEFSADLNLIATPIHNCAPDKVIQFSKTIKLTARAAEPVMLRYLRHPDGSTYEIQHQVVLPQMRPGTTYRSQIILENRSKVTSRILVCLYDHGGPSISIVAVNGHELRSPQSKLTFDTHGYVDLEDGHLNYHSVTLTIMAKVPVCVKDVKTKMQMLVYAASAVKDLKHLCSLEFTIPVLLPRLFIPQHGQHIELHEEVRSCSVPIRNCFSKHLQVTVTCNNPAFATHPVEMTIAPYATVPLKITFDQSEHREQASVVITVEPEGPVYTVNVDGRGSKESAFDLVTSNKVKFLSPSDGSQQTAVMKKTSSLPAIYLSSSCEDSLDVSLKHHSLSSKLSGKVILADCEYLFFTCNSSCRPERRLCILKNNSSYPATIRLSISQFSNLFAIKAIYKGEDNEVVSLEGNVSSIDAAPLDLIKVVLEFHNAHSTCNSKAPKFFSSSLTIQSMHRDGLVHSLDPIMTNRHLQFEDSSVQSNTSSAFHSQDFSLDQDLALAMLEDNDSFNVVKLPLFAYSGTSFVEVSVKQFASANWNTSAVVSVKNTGDRFAYVVITSSHGSDASPRCFTLNPHGGEVQITKLFLKPGLNGHILEVTWGDSIIKHLYDKFCIGKCINASPQVHQFLIAPYSLADSHNQSDNLPQKKEELPNLDPAIFKDNIYTTEISITNDSLVLVKGGSSSKDLLERLAKKESSSEPVSFDRPSEADFPLLVSTPTESLKVQTVVSKSRTKTEPSFFVIEPQSVMLSESNTSYENKRLDLCKAVGSFRLINNHQEHYLDCDAMCSLKGVTLSPKSFSLEPKKAQQVVIQALIKKDEWLNVASGSESWGHLTLKLRLEDRRDGRVRSPHSEKVLLYLPSINNSPSKSLKASLLANVYDGPEVHYLTQVVDTNAAVTIWQVSFEDAKFGDRSESLIKFKNCYKEKIKWVLTSLSHCFMTVSSNKLPVVSPAGNTQMDLDLLNTPETRLTLFRVRYPVFRVEKTSGFLDVDECAVLKAEFWPIEIGKYIQHWELTIQSRTRSESPARTHRFYFKGNGITRGKILKEVSPRKRLERIDFISDLPQEVREKFMVFIEESVVKFDCTPVGTTAKHFLFIKNSDPTKQHQIKFLNPEPPFVMNHGGYEIGARKILKVPILFKPAVPGNFWAFFLIITDSELKSVIPVLLHGTASRPKTKQFSEPMGLSSEQILVGSPRCEVEESGKDEVAASGDCGVLDESRKVTVKSPNLESEDTAKESEVSDIVSECASVTVVESQYESGSAVASSSNEEAIVLISVADIKDCQ